MKSGMSISTMYNYENLLSELFFAVANTNYRSLYVAQAREKVTR